MTARKRDANKYLHPTRGKGTHQRRRRSRKRDQRPPCSFECLERRFLLAGDAAPTIDPIADLFVPEDASRQIISLSGISAGAGQPESLRISALSQNGVLVNDPDVIYQSGQTTGVIELQPNPDEHGTATIVVTVQDAGPDNDDATDSDNGVTTLTFTVDVSSINDEPTLTQPAAFAFAMNAQAPLVTSSPSLAGREYGDLHPGSVFTSSMDLTSDGTGMIVGASGGTDSEAGYVEVYQRANELSPWTQMGQQLIGDTDTSLGRAVSLNDSSTRIAISTGRAVSVMQFDSEQTVWIPLGNPILQSGIISSLDLNSSGDLLAIATADSDGIPNAQLHRFDGTNWIVEQEALTMGQDVREDVENQVAQSRVAMSANGTHLLHSIAGCGCTGTGFAQVYELNPETAQWSPLGNRIEGEGSYGSTISISGDGMTVAIGAPQLGTETELFGNGLVEVLRFDPSSAQWLPYGNSITGSVNGYQLGSAVSLTADARMLVIGSSGASTELINKGGKVSIFEFEDQTSDWQLVQEHDGPDANASFGWRTAVSATGSSVITGARGSSSSPNKNGTLFSLSQGHVIPLSGITAGGSESQSIRITAVTDQPEVTGQPIINYTSAQSKAELLFRPELVQAGIAEIQVIIEDAGLDGDIELTDDNGIMQRTFSFGVGLSNFEEDAGMLSLELGKAGSDVRISTSNEGTMLELEGDRWVGIATDDILLPAENRMLLPDMQDFGRVELVIDGERNVLFDDAAAWRMSAPLIDGQRFLRGLRSLNDESEVIYIDGGAAWQNPIDPNDINASGHVSPVDALQIINELASHVFSDPLTGMLMDPLSVETWPNRNFDQDANGRISALDALRVINYLAVQQNDTGGEGESNFGLLPQSPQPLSRPGFDSASLESRFFASEPLAANPTIPSLAEFPATLTIPENPNGTGEALRTSTFATERVESDKTQKDVWLITTNSSMAKAVDEVLGNWR